MNDQNSNSRKNKNWPIIAVFAVLYCAVSLWSALWSREDIRNQERQKATEAGVGGWKIDAETGDRHFKYGAVNTKPEDDR